MIYRIVFLKSFLTDIVKYPSVVIDQIFRIFSVKKNGIDNLLCTPIYSKLSSN